MKISWPKRTKTLGPEKMSPKFPAVLGELEGSRKGEFQALQPLGNLGDLFACDEIWADYIEVPRKKMKASTSMTLNFPAEIFFFAGCQYGL